MRHAADDIKKIATKLDSFRPLLNNVEIWKEQRAANENLVKLVGSSFDVSIFKVKSGWQRNIALRKEVSRLWQEAVKCDDMNFAFDLARWIVKDWGGINNVNDSTIGEHNFAALNKLFTLSFDRISSRSKVITLADPYTYQIYDARVAVALNVIQLAANTNCRIYFEVPSTQITWIAKGEDCFHARIPKAAFVEDFSFAEMHVGEIYSYYTQLLLKLGVETHPQLDPIEVEMALFGLAMPFSHNTSGILSSILGAERVRLRATQAEREAEKQRGP